MQYVLWESSSTSLSADHADLHTVPEILQLAHRSTSIPIGKVHHLYHLKDIS